MKILFLICFVVLSSANASAHEYWLKPETFFLAPNQKTVVRLYVGDGLTKDVEERPYQTGKTSFFWLLSKDDGLDLIPSIKDGALPIYNFSANRAGNYIFAMERNWSYIKLEPEKFTDYLREDGMEYIIAERAKLGETAKEGRERYSRFIKTLLQVGETRDGLYKKSAALRLEIMPLENPYAKKIGDKIRFKILFDSKPLAGKTVFANNRNSAEQKMTTDNRGVVTMKIDQNGTWLVRLVFMQRCMKDCGEADWESFWGAFSFGVK